MKGQIPKKKIATFRYAYRGQNFLLVNPWWTLYSFFSAKAAPNIKKIIWNIILNLVLLSWTWNCDWRDGWDDALSYLGIALRPRAHCNLFIGSRAAARKVNFLSHWRRRRGFEIHRPQRLFKIQQVSRGGGYNTGQHVMLPTIYFVWSMEHRAQFFANSIKWLNDLYSIDIFAKLAKVLFSKPVIEMGRYRTLKPLKILITYVWRRHLTFYSGLMLLSTR